MTANCAVLIGAGACPEFDIWNGRGKCLVPLRAWITDWRRRRRTPEARRDRLLITKGGVSWSNCSRLASCGACPSRAAGALISQSLPRDRNPRCIRNGRRRGFAAEPARAANPAFRRRRERPRAHRASHPATIPDKERRLLRIRLSAPRRASQLRFPRRERGAGRSSSSSSSAFSGWSREPVELTSSCGFLRPRQPVSVRRAELQCPRSSRRRPRCATGQGSRKPRP